MGLREFLARVPERGVRGTADEFRVGLRRRTNWLERRGTHIYDRDWDVLLVLDACRVDLMRSVADEYEFTTGEETIYSVGPTSRVWIENTFGPLSDQQRAETAYVTGNPWSARVDVGQEAFARYDEAWHYGWDEDVGGIHPRVLTDRAIDAGRNEDVDRLVVHYMQPHVPFLEHPELTRKMKDPETDDFGTMDTRTVWDKLRTGDVDRSDVWEAYRENLRLVLDEVALLRRNVDAERLVITADHGNAMGELAQWGHGPMKLVRANCEVPWETTTAVDEGDHEPSSENAPDASAETDAKERLRDLGYVE